MKSKSQKQTFVKDLSERIAHSGDFILVSFEGLTVPEIETLRKSLRPASFHLEVVKNRLIERALTVSRIDGFAPFLSGATAILLAKNGDKLKQKSDALPAAKALIQFAKERERLAVKAAFLEGRLFSSEEVRALAALPSRKELLERLCSALLAPMMRLAAAVSQPMRSLAAALAGVSHKKAQA